MFIVTAFALIGTVISDSKHFPDGEGGPGKDITMLVLLNNIVIV